MANELPLGRHGVRLILSFDREMLLVRIGSTRWRHIRQGKSIVARTTDWYAGRTVAYHWHFNSSSKHSLELFRDDGSLVFAGQVSDAEINERVTKDEERYERTLHRMHIATERNQPCWGLCPYPTKPRWNLSNSVEDYEKERAELREARYHWFLMYSLSRQPSENTSDIWV